MRTVYRHGLQPMVVVLVRDTLRVEPTRVLEPSMAALGIYYLLGSVVPIDLRY